MSVETKYTPYDHVITVGNEASWMKLSVSNGEGGFPIAAVSTSCCKFSTINVPLTLFADIYVDGLDENCYFHPDLEETTTLYLCNGAWELLQSWSGGPCIASITIAEDDMKDLTILCLRLCGNTTVETKMSRFTVVPESTTCHCCFEASVVDSTEEHTIECYEINTAELVSSLLNKYYESKEEK